MKTWLLTLDQEIVWWLSNLMKSMRDAYHDDKPLILGSADAANAIDIIQQIGHIDLPKIKDVAGLCIKLEMDED